MQKGRDARAKALTTALDDMDEWLCTGTVSLLLCERCPMKVIRLHFLTQRDIMTTDSTMLNADEAQVAICDATNSTNERRDFLVGDSSLRIWVHCHFVVLLSLHCGSKTLQ